MTNHTDCTTPCDGTGWTGNPRVICSTHYESNTLGEFR